MSRIEFVHLRHAATSSHDKFSDFVDIEYMFGGLPTTLRTTTAYRVECICISQMLDGYR